MRRRRVDRVRKPFRMPGRRTCRWQTLNDRHDRQQSPGPDDVDRTSILCRERCSSRLPAAQGSTISAPVAGPYVNMFLK